MLDLDDLKAIRKRIEHKTIKVWDSNGNARVLVYADCYLCIPELVITDPYGTAYSFNWSTTVCSYDRNSVTLVTDKTTYTIKRIKYPVMTEEE
jgi:hypothetical protein